MQELLERLEIWLQQNKSDYLSQLQDGLSIEEIAETTSPLGFKLSNEVIQLYKWHNGSSDTNDEFFLFYRFLPLKDAVEDTLKRRKDAEEYPLHESTGQTLTYPNHYDWQHHWLSIFYQFKVRIVALGYNHASEYSPIIYYEGEDSWTNLWFMSLKGFISALLECCETDIYLLEDFSPSDTEDVCAKYRDLI
jgi:cell wall assembly regulator SMI1